MKVTDFRVEPAVCAPGEAVNFTFTVAAERGDVIGEGGLYVWIALPGSGERICCRDSGFTIAAGQEKAVSARGVPAESGYAASARATLLESFGVQLGQYGSRCSASGSVTLLDGRWSPSVSLFSLERASDGVPDDEGEGLLADVLLGASASADTSAMFLRLYYSSGAAPGQDAPYIDLSGRIPTLLQGVMDSADLITDTFSRGGDWYFRLVFGDAYETAQASCLVARAFANMHLSGSSTGGVCFGGFSTAGENDPRLESHYPAYFYGGIARIGGEWTDLVPFEGSTPGEYGGGVLRCRAIGDKRIVAGSLLVKPGSGTLLLAHLPEGYTPSATVFSINACQGSRIARIAVGGAGEDYAGRLALSWVRSLTDGSVYTDSAIWVQCSIEYWVD